MQTSIRLFVMLALAAVARAQSGAIQLKDLPAAVQRTVQANLAGATVKHIGKEIEDGATQYEVDTVRNGKARDFNVDANGNLLVVEEAVDADRIPAAAKAGILKKVGGGKLGQIEAVTRPGKPVVYEAAFTDAQGKQHEVVVGADGKETKL